jgi:phosphate starvation-inducible protein PhoH
MAGTGKTFLALAMALQDMMAGDVSQKKVTIVRSVLPTRDIGFLPGSIEEKIGVYEAPYIALCTELFGRADAYGILKSKGVIEFIPTSFVRGVTIQDSIIILDEVNNCTFHEIDSIITRPGKNCRLLICGDMRQSDLTREQERAGLGDFIRIVDRMKSFSHIEFEEEDIVRSDLVKEYLIAKDRYLRTK